MTTTRPLLPGTLHGLIEAGTALYRDLQETDDLLSEALASLATIERAVQRGDRIEPLLFQIGEALRTGEDGRWRVHATLRRYGVGASRGV